MAKSINRLLAELVEPDGDVKASALDNAPVTNTVDSAAVVSIADTAGIGLSYLSTLDSLPTSGLSQGDQAFVEANKRLYVSNGNGWYNVSLINLTPQFDSDINSAFSIIDSQTPLVISNPASDSDNPDAIITYGGTMSDSGQYLVALTRDSSVWTFTPLSADSVYDNVTLGNIPDSNGGTFTYSFTASDNINQAVKTITITYDGLALPDPYVRGPVDSSQVTAMLMKSVGSGVSNTTFYYLDSNGDSAAMTTNGTIPPTGSNMSPFRDGGYSFGFTGDNNIQNCLASFGNPGYSAIAQIHTTFYIEAWIYMTKEPATFGNPDPIPAVFHDNHNCDNSTAYGPAFGPVAGRTLEFTWFNGSRRSTTTSTVLDLHKWYHIAVSVDSGTIRIFLDGQQQTLGGTTTYDGLGGSEDHFAIGGGYYAQFHGYIRDLRVTILDPVKTSNFTPSYPNSNVLNNYPAPAADRVRAGLGPYIFNYASPDYRNIQAKRRAANSPWSYGDYKTFSQGDSDGSVYFSKATYSGLKVTDYATVFGFGSSDFTMEAWIYPINTYGQPQAVFSARNTSTYRAIVGVNSTGTCYGYLPNSAGSSWQNLLANTTHKVSFNSWNHIALVKNSSNASVYVNGKGTNLSGTPQNQPAPLQGGIGFDWDGNSLNNEFNGWISNARITHAAVYSGDFALPFDTNTLGVSPSPLTILADTKLLMNNKHGVNVYDAAAANAMKTVGVLTQPAGGANVYTVTPFNLDRGQTGSVFFDGSGDYIECTPEFDDPRYYLGTQDWTIEGWFKPTNVLARTVWSFMRAENTTNGKKTPHLHLESSSLYYKVDGTNRITGSFTGGGWQHWAVTRNGNDHKLFVNGSQTGSTWTNNFNYQQGRPVIGNYYSAYNTPYSATNNQFTGFMQDFRITIGKSRYNANFTVPSVEFEL